MFTGEVTFQNDSIVSMLSRIEAICGPFPRHMIAQGRQSGRFFTKSGLLFEAVDGSEDSKNTPDHDDSGSESNKNAQFDIFQPKSTNLSSRLGFDAELMDDFSEANYRTNPEDPERQEQQMFTDFISRVLTIDPDGRLSAEEALEHPWIKYAEALTEMDIKYPSS
jgi:serine/threonine protein kinase